MTNDASVDAVARRRLFHACPHSIHGHGHRSASALLAEIPDDVDADVYGDGGVVETLETEVADLLDFEAGVFMPTGTMAQQIALRIHADDTGCNAVALHPTSHLIRHEALAHEWLHGLRTVHLGADQVVWTQDDLQDLIGPVGTVGLELPLRELGGILPAWDLVAATRRYADGRDARLHLDGARLWEAAAGYGVEPADVARPFDTVYVSFYKSLGAIAGAALVGDHVTIQRARVWRQRHGGRPYALWPYAASALVALRKRLPRMGRYLDTTKAIATGLADVEGLDVVPSRPDTSMLHLYIQASAAALASSTAAMADEHGIATWSSSRSTIRPGWRMVELAVCDAAVDMGADGVVEAISEVVQGARQRDLTQVD